MLTLPNPPTLILTLTIRTHYRNFRRLEAYWWKLIVDTGWGEWWDEGVLSSLSSSQTCASAFLGHLHCKFWFRGKLSPATNLENVKIPRQIGQSSEDKVGQQALEGSSTEHTEVGRGEAGAKGTKRHQTENPASPSAQTAMFTMNNRLWFLSGFYFPPVLGIKPMA